MRIIDSTRLLLRRRTNETRVKERKAKHNLQRLKSLFQCINSRNVETATFSSLNHAELGSYDVLKKASRFGLKALNHYTVYRLEKGGS